MTVIVNGEKQNLDDAATVGDLLASLGLQDQRVAVMVNGDIVRRPDHAARRLEDADAVDVVHMVGGG
jgi:thiamine biosynthesis protein ThiS